LTEKEISNSGYKGCAEWLAGGLKIQESQYGASTFINGNSTHDLVKLTGYTFKPT
jgi:hypothetical protein